MKGKKYGADESGKTFGPDREGWYYVEWTPEPSNVFCPYAKPCPVTPGRFYGEVRAKSAFLAAAHFGRTLSNSDVTYITYTAVIAALEKGNT